MTSTTDRIGRAIVAVELALAGLDAVLAGLRWLRRLRPSVTRNAGPPP
ncbi:MAG TPA: hypothetical protein VHA57_09465 [Actinomycetota bacterium]|nr:hypothetical protein [Actinomycetota bacterium]